MNCKNILITGGSGRVGNGLIEKLSDLFYPGTTINLLVNREYFYGKKFPESFDVGIVHDICRNYDLAIHLAANANTKFAEDPNNHAKIREINIGLTKKVCDYSDKVIFASTDQVFNGNLNENEEYFEYDKKNPCSFYGETKADAEEVVLNNKGSVLRFQTVTGVRNRITENVRNVLKGKKDMVFYSDNILKTTHFPDIFNVLKKSMQNFRPGIYHIASNGKPLSRYEMALEILKAYQENGLERKTEEIKSETHLEYPRRLSLNSDKAQKEFALNFYDVKDSLKEQALLEYNL